MNNVMISQDRLDDLMDAKAKLQALECGGVDNWEFYHESLKGYFIAGAREELINSFIEGLNSIIAEAEIEEPAGRGAGYSVTFDDLAVKRMLVSLIRDYIEEGE